MAWSRTAVSITEIAAAARPVAAAASDARRGLGMR